MGRERCILNNCRNLSSDVKLFRFPFKNKNQLMELWLEKIPKDLYEEIKNPAFICEEHFERKFIKSSNGQKKLHPEAIPTIFEDSEQNTTRRSQKLAEYLSYDGSNCRFCLRKLKEVEKKITINFHIKKQFFAITQMELKNSETFSQNICEVCFNSTRDFATFRTKLIENQEKIEEAFKGFEKLEQSEDEILLNTENERVLVKIEEESCGSENSARLKVEHNLDFMCDWPDLSTSSTTTKVVTERKSTRKSKSQTLTENNASKNLESSTTISLSKPTENPNQKKRICELCGKFFSSMTYKRHFDNMHLRKKRCICDICGYKSFKKFDMKHHIFRHLKIKSFFCHECPASFPSKTELRAHLTVHTIERNFVCDNENCKATFKKKDSLKRHQRIHINNRQHECNECSRKFHDAYRLRLHQQSVHAPPDPSQQSPCPVCHKVFKNSVALSKHLVYHKPPELRCEICAKEFYRKIVLRTHMRVAHEGKKNFHCKYCSSSYFKNSHLNRHILTVHMKQKVRCEVEGCNQTFPLKDRYRVHINSHHQNLGEVEVKKLLDGIKNVEVTYENPEFELNPALI